MMSTDESNLNLYLKAIQDLKEDDFSKKILKPLFESMSFDRVDFVGGPYENGKDLIASLHIPLKGTMVYVIQTKKIGVNSNTSEKNVLSSLVTQLRQCFTKKITLHNGESQLPDAVYLASPFQINQRLLDEIHEQLCMESKTIEILDGPAVISHIKKYKPSLLEGLLTISDKLQIHDIQQLNNLELISAINQKKTINELNCYSDLAFFMGTIDSNVLLDSSFAIKKEEINFKKSSWDFFNKEVYSPLETLLGFQPLTKSNQEVEDLYKRNLKRHKSLENLEIKKNITQAEQLISTNNNNLNRILEDISSAVNSMISKESESDQIKMVADFYALLKGVSESHFSTDKFKELEEFIDNHGVTKLANKNKQSIFTKFIEAKKHLRNIIIQKSELFILTSEYVEAPSVNINLNYEKISSWIGSKCQSYKESISAINSNKENVDIFLFLNETQRILNTLDILLNKDEDNKKFISITSKASKHNDGLSISPFELFDCKYDIAVYGGAGAGKTTTLQMYVRKLIDNKKCKVIYIPLNRYISQVNVILNEEISHYDILLSIILLSKKMEPISDNISTIKSYLSKETKLKLILDGLDEAYAKYPGIVEAVNKFKTNHPDIQIIISSRDCVSYLSEINFLGITLLPFSEVQLYKFITSWFKDKSSVLGERLITSIRGREIAEIVRTPLLATLICDLTEKGVDIPSSESEIFTKRLNLFCGLYDTYKTIRRTELSQDILFKAAIKIAYALHVRNLRSATKNEMIQYLKQDDGFVFSDETCIQATNELIDPCNIIVIDAISGRYSFGHLRYQEHLASLELQQNRSIDILPYLKNDWWRGVLCLYAQCCEFQSLIEDFTHKYHNIEPALITFREMAKFRPERDKKAVLQLLINYERTDDSYYYTSGDDYTDDWRDISPSIR
jgi:hypothetical protein